MFIKISRAGKSARQVGSSTGGVALALTLALGGLVSGAEVAFAAGHATVAMGDQSQNMQIEWQDAKNARFTLPAAGDNSYTILHDGKIYMVANGEIIPGNLMSGFAAMAKKKHPSTPAAASGNGDMPTLVGPKGTKTVAGISGQVFTLHWKDGASPKDTDIVLTKNKKVSELWAVWAAYGASMGSFGGVNTKKRAALMANLFAGRGVLRMGNTFHLVKIDSTPPAAADLALPQQSPADAAAMDILQGFFNKN